MCHEPNSDRIKAINKGSVVTVVACDAVVTLVFSTGLL